MPKMKTSKTVKKRLRVSGSGRVRRPKAGGNHGLINKSRKRLRRLRRLLQLVGVLLGGGDATDQLGAEGGCGGGHGRFILP